MQNEVIRKSARALTTSDYSNHNTPNRRESKNKRMNIAEPVSFANNTLSSARSSAPEMPRSSERERCD